MKKIRKEKEKPEGVTYTQSFAAIIQKGENGKKSLVVKSPRWYQFQINKFKIGQEVSLVIHSRKAKRTEQQNRYYWGAYLPLIAEETGEKDLDRLHELFKGKFLTEGIVDVLGEKVRIKRSTTDMNVGEFCQYIMDIEALTRVKSPPTENYGLAPLQNYPQEDIADNDNFL